MYIWQNIALADVAGLVELQKWKWRPPLISGSWWNYPEILTGLFIFNIIISIIITIITSIIIFKPSPSS